MRKAIWLLSLLLIACPAIKTEASTFEEECDLMEEEFWDELELLALITMAEAEGEPEEGKRLVIDVILNRCDSELFPDTITEVIEQPHQFSPMSNGRINRVELNEDVCRLVLEELECRTNSEVLYFNSIGYQHGKSLFKVGRHYFSGR